MEIAIAIAVFALVAAAVYFIINSNKSDGGSPPPPSSRPAPSVSPGNSARSAGAPLANSGGSKRNWLVGIAGEVKDKTFHIGARTVTIGRAPTNFVQVNDEDASRIQARLAQSDRGLEITDMKSKNGTFLNGARITKDSLLKDGDEIRVGSQVFVYRVSGNFASNAGLQRKSAGKDSIKSTEQAGFQFEDMVIKTLRKTGGDVTRTAGELGVDVEMLEKFMSKHDIKPEG